MQKFADFNFMKVSTKLKLAWDVVVIIKSDTAK